MRIKVTYNMDSKPNVCSFDTAPQFDDVLKTILALAKKLNLNITEENVFEYLFYQGLAKVREETLGQLKSIRTGIKLRDTLRELLPHLDSSETPGDAGDNLRDTE